MVMGSNGHRTLKSKNPPGPSEILNFNSTAELEPARLVHALSELHDLLEAYAPSWYTEEHHEKVMAALRPQRKL
jgi:hypothetical protein